jgi:polyphosphate kinase
VEAITPVENPRLLKKLQEILGIMLADNRQAWELNPDGSYTQRKPMKGQKEQGTHQTLMKITLNSVVL